jgi:quercetin dioxygenase-like cupin family protein
MDWQIPDAGTRLVVIGDDDQGRSGILRESAAQHRTVRKSGNVLQEIWRQERLPAQVGDDGVLDEEMPPAPPLHGASVRIFTVPPDAGAPARKLGGSTSLYIATIVSGQVYLILETAEVLLGPGESFVLPGSAHAWRNPFDRPAQMICTVFHLDPAQGR